ncbi:MAG: putative quinol monooxygenase [Candidatus Dormibacteria bacterium]
MYGTVSRYRIKPGSEAAVLALSRELAAAAPPGFVASYTYRLDSGGDEYITAAMWTDRQTYRRNADDPRQQRWFEQVQGHLVGVPAWSDGEVIDASHPGEPAASAT